MTKHSIFRLTAENKAHLKNIRESLDLKSDTAAVQLALKKYSAIIEQVKAKKQREQGL